MAAAAAEARQADTWIGPAVLRERLNTLFPDGLPDSVERRILDSRRMRRRLSQSRMRLFNLFLERPELAPWLASPEALERMPALFGAQKHGAKLKAFIKRADVETIVDRIGPDAYRLALEQTGDPIMLDRDPSAVLDDIDTDGCADVRGFLSRATGDLGIDLGERAAGPGERRDHTADDNRALTKLLSRVQL